MPPENWLALGLTCLFVGCALFVPLVNGWLDNRAERKDAERRNQARRLK